MTAQRTVDVRIEPVDGNEPLVRATLATLPLSFRTSRDGRVVAVSGKGEWADRAAGEIETGAEGVLVTEPEPTSVGAVEILRELAARRSTPVRLACEWADDPAVAGFARAHSASADTGVFVDAHAVVRPGGSLIAALVSQLTTVARAFQAEVRIERCTGTPSGYSASGRLLRTGSHEPLVLSAVRSEAVSPRVAVRRLTRRGRARIELFGAGSARPALAALGDGTGELSLPTIYETAYRAAWRALHRDLRTRRVETTQLSEFARMCAVARAVTSLDETTGAENTMAIKDDGGRAA